MHVYSAGHVWVGLARHHPAGAMEGVPIAFVVTRDEVHHHHVVRHVIQTVQTDLERRKHPPTNRHTYKIKTHRPGTDHIQTHISDTNRHTDQIQKDTQFTYKQTHIQYTERPTVHIQTDTHNTQFTYIHISDRSDLVKESPHVIL